MDLECKMEVKMKDMQIYGQYLSRKTQFWALVGWDLVDPNVYVRRYDINKKVYPQDLTGEVHVMEKLLLVVFGIHI